MRLVLAFVVFIGSTVGTGYILGRVGWELTKQPSSLTSKPTSATAFTDEELLALADKWSDQEIDALTTKELIRAAMLIKDKQKTEQLWAKLLGKKDKTLWDKLADEMEAERDRTRAELREKLPDEGKAKESWAIHTGPVAPYPFLIGHVFGGVFGLMAGWKLLRAGRES